VDLDIEPLHDAAQAYIEKVADRLRGEGLNVTSEVTIGTAAGYILQEADRDPGALIAISTHGRSGLARLVLGGTTSKIVHAATNPVLVIRPAEQPSSEVAFQHLIVPLDGSAVAEQVLPHAIELAKGLNVDITLITAVLSEFEYRKYIEERVEVIAGSTATRVFKGPYEEFKNEAAAKAMRYLHEVSKRLKAEGVPNVSQRLLQGQPADAIISLAQEIPGSLVAMTTHGRSGVQRWLLGSVADRVVRQADAPVLLIRAQSEG
jgi:nucleotide-binding universal stress UspA family protein